MSSSPANHNAGDAPSNPSANPQDYSLSSPPAHEPFPDNNPNAIASASERPAASAAPASSGSPRAAAASPANLPARGEPIEANEEGEDGENALEKEFPDLLPDSEGLTTEEAEALLKEHGKNELTEKSTPSWLIFLKCLWGPMPFMLWAAAIIEMALENYIDGGILFGILFANAIIGWYETMKAGNAVRALKESLKPSATVKRDGKWVTMDATLLVPGDLVKLAAGSAVPADCSIHHGQGPIDVDEAALTGESLPVSMDHTHMPKMGSNVVRGEVDGTVQFTGMKTFFGKTAMMIGSVGNSLGNVHYILIRTVVVLTVVSLLLCVILFIYIMAGRFRLDFKRALEFTVVLLVVSVPLAVEIVVTTTLAMGSKQLSKHKVIVSQLSSIEMMAAVDMLCSDKTGTLTQNKMQLQDDCPVFADGHDRQSVIQLAALAAKWREPPRDALDTMVLGAAVLDECDEYDQLEFNPFDPRVKRTSATLRKTMPDGTPYVFKVAKGAPHAILNLCGDHDSPVALRVEAINEELSSRGIRCIAIAQAIERRATTQETTARPVVQEMEEGYEEGTAQRTHSTLRRNTSGIQPQRQNSAAPKAKGSPGRNLALEPAPPRRQPSALTQQARREASHIQPANDGEQWVLIGLLTFLDPPRIDTKETIRRAKEYGVDVKMITGDNELVAREMCRMLDMDDNIQTPEHLPKFPESGNPKDIPTTLGKEYGDLIISAGGFARVYPEHKYLIVETLRQRGFTCAMTGDGVNDAPALKRADVGIAVEGATDAARAAADMILTNPGLSVVVEAMLIARGVFQRIVSFLTYRVAATLQLVTFFFIGVFAFPLEDFGIYDEEFVFFRFPVLLFMLITVLNDGTLITIGYDRVTPSNRPQRWNLKVLFVVASVMGAVACASSLWLLWMGVNAVDDEKYANSWFKHMGIPQISQGKLVTMLYLKVSISDFLTLFSSRTGGRFFFTSLPSLVLLIGAGISLLVSSLVASLLPDGTLDKIKIEGLSLGHGAGHKLMPVWVWLYCIVWWWIQDIAKVITHLFLDHFNLLDYRIIPMSELAGVPSTVVANDSEMRNVAASPSTAAPARAPSATNAVASRPKASPKPPSPSTNSAAIGPAEERIIEEMDFSRLARSQARGGGPAAGNAAGASQEPPAFQPSNA